MSAGGGSAGEGSKTELILAALKAMKDKHDAKKEQRRQEKREDKKEKERLKLETEERNSIAEGEKKRSGFFRSLVKSDTEAYPFIFIILAIFAHLMTILWDPPSWTIVTGVYLLLIVAGFFFHSRKIDGDETELFIAVIVAIAAPYLFSMFRSSIDYNWVIVLGGIIMFSPFVAIYLMTKSPVGTGQHKFLTGYMMFWCIVCIFYLITTPFAQSMNINAKSVLGNPGQIFGYTVKWVGDSFTKFMDSVDTWFKMMQAQATGQPLPGEQDERRGVYIENFKPIEREFYTSTDARLEAQVTGVNLAETVHAETSCYIPGKTVGSTYPEEVDLKGNTWDYVSCNLGTLPKGSYQATMASTFIYQTDSNIVYYFVDENTEVNLYKDMKIPATTIAKYYGGPVAVGLTQNALPMTVNVSKPKAEHAFGVSLQNMWPQGKIIRGLNFILDIPEGVELTHCNRNATKAGGTPVDGRVQYTFSIDTANAKETFDSVSCTILIKDPSVFFGTDLVAIKTFSAKVTYEYLLEQSTYILVKDDYTNT